DTKRGVDPAALKPYADAADLIRLNLFTPLGRAADDARFADETGAPAVSVTAFGLSGFGWPRCEVLARAATTVARRVLKRWAAPDLRRARELMPAIAQQKWSQ